MFHHMFMKELGTLFDLQPWIYDKSSGYSAYTSRDVFIYDCKILLFRFYHGCTLGQISNTFRRRISTSDPRSNKTFISLQIRTEIQRTAECSSVTLMQIFPILSNWIVFWSYQFFDLILTLWPIFCCLFRYWEALKILLTLLSTLQIRMASKHPFVVFYFFGLHIRLFDWHLWYLSDKSMPRLCCVCGFDIM